MATIVVAREMLHKSREHIAEVRQFSQLVLIYLACEEKLVLFERKLNLLKEYKVFVTVQKPLDPSLTSPWSTLPHFLGHKNYTHIRSVRLQATKMCPRSQL